MLKLVFFTTFFLASATFVFSQEIPANATIIETRHLSKTRKLALWMQSPEKHPRFPDDGIYTCPDATRGHYYTGIANVSLINTKTKKVVNTIGIQGNGISSEENRMDLPYLIKPGYYRVSKVGKSGEGKPTLIDLKDLNNDGKPHEFAIFDAQACMGLQTALIGYSEKRDKVMQYQTELKTAEGTSLLYWVDYFFAHEPNKNGTWEYQVDYRGRGGKLDRYQIRYDAKREAFFGKLDSIGDDEK